MLHLAIACVLACVTLGCLLLAIGIGWDWWAHADEVAVPLVFEGDTARALNDGSRTLVAWTVIETPRAYSRRGPDGAQ